MVVQANYLSNAEEVQILSEVINCFDHAKDKEAIFKCMTRFSRKFTHKSYYASKGKIEFTRDALRITTILFREKMNPEEPMGKSLNELDPDDKIFYRVQLKKALISN